MTNQRNIYTGIGLAIIATIIWSGNFVVARGIFHDVPPITLSFFRWSCATIILLPFALKSVQKDWPVIRQFPGYFFLTALTGITLFNTFVYIGGQYTTAVNLALIGTTSSPIIAVILARIFLKEAIGWQKLTGMLICITGVLVLLSKGNIANLLPFQFTSGDGWVLLAGLAFAIYNTMVKKKPAGISPLAFLFTCFALGMLLLIPGYAWETIHATAVNWSWNVVLVILYLGLGASVISFLIWNTAIHKLGAGRTAIFGNLIPIFSSLEAVAILGETISWVHILSFAIVITGLLIANYRKRS